MSARAVTPLERRVAAAQATLRRFEGRKFRWGREDCVRMAAWHLRRLGYKLRLPPTDGYRSARSAMAAMRAAGHVSIEAALDSYGLPRIAPAAVLPGDILMCPGEAPIGGALHVALGNGATVGYHQDAIGACVLRPVQFVAAWRADPQL